MNQKTFHVKFTGRQSQAIGIFYTIHDTYKADSIGKMMYMLYTDYEHISGLQVWEDKSEPYSYREPELIPASVIETTKMIKFKYPKRETSPNTGTYRYTRRNAPENYKW